MRTEAGTAHITSAVTRAAARRTVAMAAIACLMSSCSATGTTTVDLSNSPKPSAELEIGALNFDPTKYCGDKPMKIGLLDGFGGNSWRRQVRAINENFRQACPNITEIQYYNANLDSQKYANALNTWAAQGFNVVYAYPDFGELSLPAYRNAQKAGVKVGTSNSPLGDNVVPEQVTASVVTDLAGMARQFVEFLDSATEGTAHILVVGGPAGNSFDPTVIAYMNAVAEETDADVKFLQPNAVVGNWDTAQTARSMASVIAKYPQIDGIVLTSMAVAPAVIRAFANAGKPVPALAGTGSTNEVVCDLAQQLKLNPDFAMFSADASGNVPPLALVKAIASYQGIDAPELGPVDAPMYVQLPAYIDTLKGLIPKCDPSVPLDADLSMALSPAQIAEVG
jgi:ribose transport system substrate-binding protein